jgi:hypothetical protein
MLTFEFPINAIALLGLLLGSGLIGFRLRRSQIAKIHKKLVKAENEMINSHAEILEIQKEYISLELKLRGIKDPVIAISNPTEAATQENLPGGALRKKMLMKDFTPTRHEGYNLIYDNLVKKEAGLNAAS